jgi:hypothetical protein
MMNTHIKHHQNITVRSQFAVINSLSALAARQKIWVWLAAIILFLSGLAPQASVFAAPIIPTTHPRIWLVGDELVRLRANLAGATPASVRFKDMVDRSVGGANIYGYEPWYSAMMGVLTTVPAQRQAYCQHAITKTETFVASEEVEMNAGRRPEVAGDDYLEIGSYVGNIAKVYDWCNEYVSAAQKTRWLNYSNTAIWNVWNQKNASWAGFSRPGSEWSINNPVNNYYYSFLRASMLFGLATKYERVDADTWLNQFRNVKIRDQLVPIFERDLVGGGSREGTGYGTAARGLFNLYFLWEKSTGERMADFVRHTADSQHYLMHVIAPTRDKFAPIGDHARDASATFFDYHRETLLALASLYSGTPVSNRIRQFLPTTNVPRMGQQFQYIYDFMYDGAINGPTPELNTVYHAAGVGHIFARSDWSTTATWMSFLTGPYSESHAHPDGLSIMLYKNGWLVNDANMQSRSGLSQVQSSHALVTQRVNGTELDMYAPDDGSSRAALTALSKNQHYFYAAANQGTLFNNPSTPFGNPGAISKREIIYVLPSTVVVLDRVEYTGGTSVKTFHLPTPNAVTVNGRIATSTNPNGATLAVHALHPVNSAFTSTPIASLDADIRSGNRIDSTVTSSGETKFLNVLSVDNSATNIVSATPEALSMTMADGRTVVISFNQARPGGNIVIRNAANQILVQEPLATAVATLPRMEVAVGRQVVSVTKNGAGQGSVVASPQSIDCGSNCSANFDTGSRVTLTATASVNSIFTGWSGACAGVGICAVNVGGDIAAVANFALATPTVPSAPLLLTATNIGNAAATLSFQQPENLGGSPILYYNLHCTSSNNPDINQDIPASPYRLTGLVNGALYECAIAAVNITGESVNSRVITFTPTAAPSIPTIISAEALTARRGVAFNYQLVATGSPAPTFSFVAADSRLPDGVTLSPSGLLSGTPAAYLFLGNYPLKAVVSNGPGSTSTQNITIQLSATTQTINFVPISDRLLSTTVPVTISATSSSGLPVTVRSLSLSTCTVSGLQVRMVTAGNCLLAAEQSGNTVYAAANQANQSFVITTNAMLVPTTPQVITFAPITDKALSTIPVPLTATSDSALAVAYAASPANVCSVNGTNIVMNAAGACTVTANQAGDTTFLPAASVSRTFNITTSQLTIQIVKAGFGEGRVVSAPAGIDCGAVCETTSGTGNPVTLTATAEANSRFVSWNSNGLCADDANPACTLASNGIITLTLNAQFDALTASVTSAPRNVVAVAGNRLITLTYERPTFLGGSAITLFGATCRDVNGNAIGDVSTTTQIIVRGLTNGLAYVCGVVATNGSGNSAETNAPSATPNGLEAPAITSANSATFTINAMGTYDVNYAFTATGSPAPTYQLTGTTLPAGLSLNTQTGVLSGNTAAGNANYVFTLVAANNVGNNATQSFTLSLLRNPQVITFPALTDTNFGTSPSVFGVSTSNLTLSYTVTTPTICSIGGTTITTLRAGTCTISASQAGDSQFAPAASVERSFAILAVSPAIPTITDVVIGDTQATFTVTPDAFTGGAPISLYIVNCVPQNGNPVQANSMTSTVALTGFLNGSTYQCFAVTRNSVGRTSNDSATRAVVTKGRQTLLFNNVPTSLRADAPPFAINVTGQQLSSIQIVTSTPTICLVNAMPGSSTGTVSLVGSAGRCTLQANAGGSNSFFPGTANASFEVTPLAPPTPTVPQSVTFGVVPSRVYINQMAFAITATALTTVTLSSTTPAICAVDNGMLQVTGTVGICTIRAEAAESAEYLAASASVTIAVTKLTPDAPLNLACEPALSAARCRFEAPLPNNKQVITGYTLSCQVIAGTNPALFTVDGAQSPMTLSNLPTGKLMGCTVAARNADGLGLASITAFVTPYSMMSRRGIDIDGDGKGEVLVRTLDGRSFMGSLDATTNKISFTSVLDAGANWRVLGVGDFGGRGRSDLPLQSLLTGDVKLWTNFDGPLDGNEKPLRNVKRGWAVEAIADIDGDGKSDIVWRFYSTPANPSPNPNDNGVVFVWYMNDGVISEVKNRGGAPISWNLVGAADLNGSGQADLVWVSPTGAIRRIKSLPNRAYQNEFVSTVPLGYTLTRLGDFNGDGRADLLFRNAAGKLQLQAMGELVIEPQQLPDTNPTWTIFAVVDLNGDGTVDIVFRKPDNTLVVWLMQANAPATPTVIDDAGVLPGEVANIDP